MEKVHRNFYEDSLVTIHTETDAIRATVYHPMWVLAGRDLDDRPDCQELSPNEDEGLTLPGRWVNSHDLRPGDVLIDTAGNKQYVMRVEQEFVSGFAIVNLTVEGDHTFAVGTAGLLVHNTCAKPVAVAPVCHRLARVLNSHGAMPKRQNHDDTTATTSLLLEVPAAA